MKLLLLFFTLLLSLYLNAQSDDLGFEVVPPKDVQAYSIYWYPTSHQVKDQRLPFKVLEKKVELVQGREKKITKWVEGKVFSVQTNYYQDTLLVKSITKYPKATEVYYYYYDSLSKDPIGVKGYENKTLVYQQSAIRRKDTLEVRTVYSSDLIKAKECELIYYSFDSLTKTTIGCLAHQPDMNYQIERYNAPNVLRERIDSSAKTYRVTKNFYDSFGRLKEVKWYEDTALTNLFEYSYRSLETVLLHYNIYSNKDTVLSGQNVKRFDERGNLVNEESLEYDKEEFSHEKSIPRSSRKQKQFYTNGRLVRVEFYDNSEKNKTFEIVYH